MCEKITSYEVKEIDGRPCLVFVGEASRELYFPANSIETTFVRAMRQFDAYAAQHGVAAGQWRPAMMATPRTWNTGISDTGMAAIIVDRGLPSEQTLLLPPKHAEALGRQLIQTARQAYCTEDEHCASHRPTQ
jgi:hypothetical protein